MPGYQIWIICLSAGIFQVGSCVGVYYLLKKSKKVNEIELTEVIQNDQEKKIIPSKVDPINFIP